MNVILKNLAIITAVLFVAGCTDVGMPTPEEIVKRPIGTDSVKIGMTKDKIRQLWGDPDKIEYDVKNKALWAGTREEWTYFARSNLPINAGYLSKTKRLYFDHDSLTKIIEE